MEHGVIPPTMNLENPDVDAGCDLDYVPNKAYVVPKDKPLEVIISDNLGFGGHNAALAFRRYAKK
jgi:3-oxoacyl-[acyl-carrier-protein] synthase II